MKASVRLLRAALCVALVLLLPQAAFALALGIQVNPDRVRPGETVLVQITVTNDTAAPVANVGLRSRIPSLGVGGVSPSLFSGVATCPGGFCDPGEIVTWTLGLLAPGSGVTVSMVLPVSSVAIDGTLIEVPGSALLSNVVQADVAGSVAVDVDHALTLSAYTDANGVEPGGMLRYTLVYGNRSGAIVTGTTASFPLPPGTSFIAASGSPTIAAGTVNWTLGTLLSGQSGRLEVQVSVNPALASGSLLPMNAAQIAGSSPVTGAESARAVVVNRVQSTGSLGLAYGIGSEPVRTGEDLRTTLTVSNSSSGPLFNTVVRARVPAQGLSGFSPGFITGNATCPGGFCDAAEYVDWAVGTLAPGASITFSVPAFVVAGVNSGRLIVHEAEARADGVPMTLASQVVPVDSDNALSVILDADKDTIAPGELLTYTLTYGNRAASSVTGASLRLPLPPGVEFVNSTGAGSHDAGVVSWNLNVLQAGQSGRQQVLVTTSPSLQSGALLRIDAAQLSATSAATGAEAARSSLVTRVDANGLLGLAYSANADPARPGEPLRTQLTVTNRSAGTLFNTVVRARWPNAGVNGNSPVFFSGEPICPGGFCDESELIQWNVGTLAPGASYTFSLPAIVSSGFASGRLVPQEAQALADGSPQVLARRSVAVDPDNQLALAVDTDKDSVAPGQPLVYTLTYSNRSAQTSSATTLTFPLPEGAALIGASGATQSGRVLVWNLGTLLAGQGGIRTVTVLAPTTASEQRRMVVDAATVSGMSATTGAETARASRVTRVISSNPLGLTLDPVSVLPVQSGLSRVVRLAVRNSGPVPLIGVQLRVRVPIEGVNSFSPAAAAPAATCPGGFCDPAEFVNFALGTLVPGASVNITVPMQISAGLTSGRQLAFEALAQDDAGDQAIVQGTALVGPVAVDTDGDSIPDFLDNCTLRANPSQRDTDGDGYGDACDADFDNSSAVNFADLALFKLAFGSTNLLFDLDGNGSVGFPDLALFRSFFGLPPGPSGLRP